MNQITQSFSFCSDIQTAIPRDLLAQLTLLQGIIKDSKFKSIIAFVAEFSEKLLEKAKNLDIQSFIIHFYRQYDGFKSHVKGAIEFGINFCFYQKINRSMISSPQQQEKISTGIHNLINFYIQRIAINQSDLPKNIYIFNPSIQYHIPKQNQDNFRRKHQAIWALMNEFKVRQPGSQVKPSEILQNIRKFQDTIGVKRLKINQIISHAVFISKLKDLFQFNYLRHMNRLYIWMEKYIKIICPNSNITKDQIYSYHNKKKMLHGGIDKMINAINTSFENADQIQQFYDQFQNFQRVVPEYRAILQFYSVNDFSQNYKQNCAIARKFLSSLKENKISKEQKYLLSRFQYFTYLVFVLIQKERINRLKKDEISILADYSFDGNIEELQNLHIHLIGVYKNWHTIRDMLIAHWKPTYQDIERQKGNMLMFFQKKNAEKQFKEKIHKPTQFQRFLSQMQLITLNNQCHILTDNIQLVSKSLKYLLFDDTVEKYKYQQEKSQQVKSRKERKYKTYHVYLVAEFQLSSQQQSELISLREKFNLFHKKNEKIGNLPSNKVYKNQKILTFNFSSRQENEIKCEPPSDFQYPQFEWMKVQQIKVEEGNDAEKPEDTFQMDQELEQKIHKRRFGEMELQKQIKQNNVDESVKMEKSLISSLNALKLSANVSLQNQNQKLQYIQEQNIFIKEQEREGQINLCPQVLMKNTEQFNYLDSEQIAQIYPLWSFYSTDQFINENSLSTNYYQENQDFSKIKEELYSQTYQYQENNTSKETENNILLEYQFDLSNDSIERFLQSVVSQEQCQIFERFFNRKTLQHGLMKSVVKKQTRPRQKQKSLWGFHQNVKFVSFLIINKFAFIVHKLIANFTCYVMSEFIITKNPQQCANHWCYYRDKYADIHQIIKIIITSFRISSTILKKQINWQKQQYFKVERSFCLFSMLIDLKKPKSEEKSVQQIILEKFNRKQFIFNLKSDFIWEENNLKSKDNSTFEMQKITQIEKERYLNCLEIIHEKQRVVTQKRLNEYASVIFKEREVDEQVPLLQKYHQIMMKRHLVAKKILEHERNKQQKKKERKKKTEKIKEMSINLMENLFERIHDFNGNFKVQFIHLRVVIQNEKKQKQK